MLELCIAVLITSIILTIVFIVSRYFRKSPFGGLEVGKGSSEEYFKNLQTKRMGK